MRSLANSVLKGSTRLARSPLVYHAARRNMGFFDNFKKAFTAEKEKSKDLQEAMQKLQEEADKSQAVKQAAEAAKIAADAARVARDRATVEAQRAKEVAASAAKKAGEIAEDVKDRLDDLSETPIVSSTSQAMGKMGGQVAEKGGSAISKVAEVVENLAQSDLAKKVQKTFSEDEKPTSARVEGVPINKESFEIEVRPESEWERKLGRWKRMPVVGPLVRASVTVKEGTKEVLAEAGDKVFGETETGIVLGEIRKTDPNFSLPRFLLHVQKSVVPEVLSAYLHGDLTKLRPFCLERGYTILSAAIKDRESRGHKVDNKLYHVGEVELLTGRLIEDTPVLLLTFCCQQVYCVKDKTGKIVEGNESNLRSVHYVWAMMVDPDSADSDWKLLEMHIQGDFPQIA